MLKILVMVNTKKKFRRYRDNKEGYRTPARVELWVSPAGMQTLMWITREMEADHNRCIFEERKRSSSQAFEPTHAIGQAASQGLKLQARGHKLQDPGTRVQAHKLRVRGTSNKDK